MADEDAGFPWTDAGTPLARAFERALQRLDSVSGDDDAESLIADSATEEGAHLKALTLMGTDADPEELDRYLAVVAKGNLGLMNEQPLNARQILRGMGAFMYLVGSMHARAISTGGASNSLAGSPEGMTQALEALRNLGRVPTIAERAELMRDSVQWVIDLECDRLERTATALHALGLQRGANLMRTAAIILRNDLEHAGDAE